MLVALKNYVYAIDNFYDQNKISCQLKPLRIRIITEEQLNSPKFFIYIDPIMFGRYFREDQHLYLTPEALHKKRYFAHEMAHYLYDTCGIHFKSDQEEHDQIKQFLKRLK